MEKSLVTTALTVRENEVVWVAEVPVPVTVMAVVPAGVAPVVDTVMVELPPEVTDVGLKVTVVPGGAPADRLGHAAGHRGGDGRRGARAGGDRPRGGGGGDGEVVGDHRVDREGERGGVGGRPVHGLGERPGEG